MMATAKKTIALSYGSKVKFAGANVKTLVSALVGATSGKDVKGQLEKISVISSLSLNERPDIISDLSLSSSKSALYRDIIMQFPEFIVSTLPVYQCCRRNDRLDHNELLDVANQQIEAGVSFITIHPTANRNLIDLAKNRLVPWTSRGGAMVIKDLLVQPLKNENAYLRVLDELIKIAHQNGTVISLGASFRSANIFDSFDKCQLEEFKIQKQLADYISNRGVSVIIEGPGHSSPRKLKQIATIYKKMGFPIMPLGPIPTDIAIGQDHISSSIGAVLLGMDNCVDIITAVTRQEHTGGIPTISSTIEAIKAAKIAAHIIDMNKLGDVEADGQIAKYRAELQTCVLEKKILGVAAVRMFAL